ncbi:MAG: hypothetical protein V4805_04720 [Pseudomonadota bacterium]
MLHTLLDNKYQAATFFKRPAQAVEAIVMLWCQHMEVQALAVAASAIEVAP